MSRITTVKITTNQVNKYALRIRKWVILSQDNVNALIVIKIYIIRSKRYTQQDSNDNNSQTKDGKEVCNAAFVIIMRHFNKFSLIVMWLGNLSRITQIFVVLIFWLINPICLAHGQMLWKNNFCGAGALCLAIRVNQSDVIFDKKKSVLCTMLWCCVLYASFFWSCIWCNHHKTPHLPQQFSTNGLWCYYLFVFIFQYNIMAESFLSIYY